MKPMRTGTRALLATLFLLAGCASAPPTNLPVSGSVQPTDRSSPRRVEWGGQIVEVQNRRDATEFEILAYPLDRDGRPDTSAPSLGRFVAVRPGFVDPADYAPGRLVTARGSLGPARTATLGGTELRLATLEAESLQLWSREPPPPRVAPYGTIGIGFGSGGFYGGGVGLGIGF